MSTGCDFYADALVELAQGRLEAARVERVERHLAECAECRGALETIRAVRSAPAPVPEGLESRIQAAVRREAAVAPPRMTVDRDLAPGVGPRRAGLRWRAWALPLAAAAALAVWLGADELLSPDAGPPTTVDVVEYEPYGDWPASDGIVAGGLVLSELSVEELEALLEEI